MISLIFHPQFVVPFSRYHSRIFAQILIMKHLLTVCFLCFCSSVLFAQSTLVRINLYDQTRFNNGQSAADGLILVFEAGNNNGVDVFDAPKLFNIDESFARQNGTDYLSIERRDIPQDNERLLFFNNRYRTLSYVFTVQAFQLNNLVTYYKDTYTGEIFEIGNGIDGVIPFTIDNSIPESLDANRFEMTFIEKSNFIYDNTWTNLDPCLNTITATDNLNIISGDAVIDCDMDLKNITIAAGSTLQIASGRTVTVNGDINNLGTLMAQDATVIINNNSSFYSSDSQLGNLIVADNNSLELAGKIDIYADLKHTGTGATIIDNKNASLTLKSTATQTAYYLPTDLQLTSPVTTEVYMSAHRAFRFVSSPVTTTGTIYENWQENGDEAIVGFGTDITGANGAANGFDITATNNPSMYSWDNANQAWVAQSSTNTTTDVIENGKPYRLFVRGDRQVDLTTNANAQRETVLRATGTLISGDFSPTVINNTVGNFNLIGNPYAAPFNLDGLLSNLDMNGRPVDATGTRPTFFFVWDPNLQSRGAYVTYDTSLDLSLNSSSQINGYLQPYQAAFIIANGDAGDFTFKESYLNVDQSHVQVTAVPDVMRIELTQNQTVKDGVIVKFDTTFTNAIDQNDAPKITNLEENLSLLDAQNKLSIAARKIPIHGEMIQLHTSQLQTGTYEFQISPLALNGVDAYLKDYFTGNSTLLDTTAVTSYSFSIDNSNAQSSDVARFQIEFVNSTLSVNESAFAKAISLYPNPSNDGIITIQMPSEMILETVEIYNTLGQRLMTVEISKNEHQIDLSKLSKGVYLLKLNDGANSISKKVILE
ncbi:MAG: T9SS type A sorting domain-containing protein [Nonlabens sp.]|uniref:T9SS type A sorting domain-containing protein n=1 Tax=Nonlabens sp. TaxID=1888209 RepID=UPI003EF2960D